MVDEVAHFPLRQPGAVILAELSVANYGVCLRAVTAKDGPQARCREVRMAREEGVACFDARCRSEVASRERRLRGPGRLQAREIGREPLHRVLGEPAIGGDLAAEYREHGRRAGIFIDP